MGKPSPPPAPDFDRLLEITETNISANRELFDEFMSFHRDTTADQQGRAQEFHDLLIPSMERNLELQELQHERFRDSAIPFEDDYLERLRTFDTPERRDDFAAQAAADVDASFEAQRENELRRLESYGIDPSQTRSAALDARVGLGQATQRAQAATQARRATEQAGLQMGGEAVNIGRGQQASGQSALQGSLQAGQSGLNATGQANQYGQQGFGTAGSIIGQGQGMAQGGYGTAGQLHGNQMAVHQQQMEQSPLNTIAGLGGMWLGAGMPGLEGGGYIHPESSPSHGAIPDDVPVRVTAGEAVLPERVVRYHGLKTINKMMEEADKAIPEGM